jgi:hypothetical protein
VAKDKVETVEMERPVQEVRETAPKLIVMLGRGKNGKSTVIRWLAEQAFIHGRAPVIADADRTNATLSAFFDGVTRPEYPDNDGVTDWLNALLEDQIAAKIEGKPFSVLLDLGGGDLVLKEHALKLDLVSLCEQHGIEPIAVHLIGDDLDDLAYLRDIEQSGAFKPRKTLLVLNEGVMRSGSRGFESIKSSPIFTAALDRGAKSVLMPRLENMKKVNDLRLLFSAAASMKTEQQKEVLAKTGHRFGFIDSQLVTTWLRTMRTNFASVHDWLP